MKIELLVKALILMLSLMPFRAFAGSEDGLLKITQLTDNIYLHTSYKHFADIGFFPSNGLIVVNGSKAVLVDTAWSESDTVKLVKWLESRKLAVVAAIATHSHDDRTSGLAYLNKAGIPTYASKATNVLLERSGNMKAVHIFEDASEELRNFGVEVFFPGAGHASDNHVVWLHGVKMLFGGCLVRSTSTQSLGNIADAVLSEWPGSLQRLNNRFPDAYIVVPGHGEPGGRELVAHSISLFSIE